MSASVTFWEATAPVKLPAWSCQSASSWLRLEKQHSARVVFHVRLHHLHKGDRIFTGTSISPSPLSRQCSSRYSFRAGRNLPDKEFRYLRTVIVTAAVYRGFTSWLAPLGLTFRHWAGVSPYMSVFTFAETCVFGKQSLEPMSCGPLGLPVSDCGTGRAPSG